MNIPLLAALEIGSSRTTLLVGEPDENGVMHVVGKGCVPSIGVRKGEIVNFPNVVQCVTQAVTKVVAEKKFDIGCVLLAASGGYIGSLTNYGSTPIRSHDHVVSQDDIDEVQELAGSVVLPTPTLARMHTIAQKYKLDGQTGIVRPEGLKGSTLGLGMLVIHAERGPIENLQNAVSAASLDVEDVVFSALAASHAVLSQEQRDAGVAIIDLGGGTTGMVAFADGVPMDAWSLAVGGDHVTNDISFAFNMPTQRAQSLKHEYGSALPGGGSERIAVPADFGISDRTIAVNALRTVINARMDELFRIFRDRLDHKELTRKLGAGVVLTGGGAALPGVAELAQSIFRVPCTIGTLQNITGLEDEEHPESFAVPAGLLVYGMKSNSKRHGDQGGLLDSLRRRLGI